MLFYLYFLTLPVLAAAPDIFLPNYFFYFSCFFVPLNFIKHLFFMYNLFLLYYLPNPVVRIFFFYAPGFSRGGFNIYTTRSILIYYVLYVFSFELPVLAAAPDIPPSHPYLSISTGSLCVFLLTYNDIPSFLPFLPPSPYLHGNPPIHFSLHTYFFKNN